MDATAGKIKQAQAPDPAAQPGPLATGKYESMAQLWDELIALGPSPETYQRFMDMVGPNLEDDAKDALGKFFQGLASAACALYDMLVGAGIASPIDANIVEKLMSQHPELDNKQNQSQDQKNAECSKCQKCSGLYLPMKKEAATAPYPAYQSFGAGENRYCPKTRGVVNTYLCRYHCLDGLIVDDNESLCGEAIWRQAVMDKFSRPYKDADGNWVGGYLNKRFEIHYDDGGHPYQLKPGTRRAPIHEDAWAIEKRLQELRRSEGKKRGYSETHGDPKGLYNFDQHELMKGPQAPNLFGKDKEKIAKIAGTENVKVVQSMFDKTAGDEIEELSKQDPREFHKEEPSEEDLKEVESKEPEKKKDWPPKKTPFDGESKPEEKKASFNLAKKKKKPFVKFWEEKPEDEDAKDAEKETKEAKKKKKWNPNPWAVCHTTVDKDKDPEKYERCVMDVKKKQSESVPAMEKKAWGLAPASPSVPAEGDPMHVGGNIGIVEQQCKACGKKFKGNRCSGCGAPATASEAVYKSEQTAETGGIKKPELAGSEVEVKTANGVYRASNGEAYAYGDSMEEALFKLSWHSPDNDLARATTPSIDDMATEMGALRSAEVPPQAAMAPSPAPAPAPAPIPEAVPAQPPAAALPPEIEGGVSEFPPDGMAAKPLPEAPAGEAALPAEPVEKTKYWNAGDDDEEPITGDELTSHLDEAAAVTPPEEQEEVATELASMGGGPDTAVASGNWGLTKKAAEGKKEKGEQKKN